MRKIISFAAMLLLVCAVQSQTLFLKDSLHVTLDEVTVSSVRANEKSAVSYSEIGADELKSSTGAQEMPFLLSLSPSFVATSDAGTGIGYTSYSIRGTDANRVNVTINGVPLNDSESHTVFFVNTPDFSSSLSSVQIQRGVGVSTHGSAAFGASINMETEKLNTKPYAEVSTTVGSFNTFKNSLKVGSGLINEHWAFDARLSSVLSDGYVDRSNANLKSYYFAGTYLSEKTMVKLLTFGGIEKTHQAWNGVSGDLLAINPTYNDLGKYKDDEGNTQFYDNQVDNYNQTHYQLHWTQQLNADFSWNMTGHYTRGFGYYEEYKEGRKYREYGLVAPVIDGNLLTKTDLIRQKHLDNHFGGATWSLNYDKHKLQAVLGGAYSHYDGNHFGKVIWVRNAKDLNINHEWYRNKGVKDDANIFAKATVELLPRLFLNADLQYRYIHYQLEGFHDKFNSNTNSLVDLTQSHQFHFFNPKGGLTYSIDNHNDIYASFSVANREPNRKNYTEADENTFPTSERLYDTELGYRFQYENFSAGVNLFNMKYKNQLILNGKINEIGEALTTNIPDSYRRGVEIISALKIKNWFKWDANLALSQHKILNFAEYVDAFDASWTELPRVENQLGTTTIAMSPSIVFNNQLKFMYKDFSIGLLSSYVGKQYLDNSSSEDRMIPSYFVSHLDFSYSFPTPIVRSVDVGLRVNNLFNAHYVTNGYVWYSYYMDGERVNDLRYFPQAGTHFMVNLTVGI